jgi:hypothetical protein
MARLSRSFALPKSLWRVFSFAPDQKKTPAAAQ